jgi:hypothetical protein
MDLIYAYSFCKRPSVHVHIFGEGSERISVGDIEFAGDICSSKIWISEGIYDHKVSKLRVVLILFKQKELIGFDVSAGWISALPAALIYDKNELQIILHDRVIDGPGIDAL